MTIRCTFAFTLLMAMSGLAWCAEPAPAAKPSTEIARYKTFTYVEGDPQAAGIVADRQVRHRLERIVTSQLMNKGYAPAAPGQRAELGVNLAGKVTDKQ